MNETCTSGALIPAPAVRQFADTYHVLTRRDACGELIVPGRMGHVYEHGSSRFGMYLECGTKRAWSAAKRTLTAAGFTIRQNGDTEGTALFDPANERQARLALATVRARKRRALSLEQRRGMADRLGINMLPINQGVLAARSDDPGQCDRRVALASSQRIPGRAA